MGKTACLMGHHPSGSHQNVFSICSFVMGTDITITDDETHFR